MLSILAGGWALLGTMAKRGTGGGGWRSVYWGSNRTLAEVQVLFRGSGALLPRVGSAVLRVGSPAGVMMDSGCWLGSRGSGCWVPEA